MAQDEGGVITQELPPLLPGGAATIALSIVMTILPMIWTLMRIWAQQYKNIGIFKLEDIFCYFALLCNTIMDINYILMVVLGGMPHHAAELNALQLQRYEKIVLAAQIIYALTISSAKISIILMLHRIFGISRSFRWIAYGLIVVSILWLIQTILVGFIFPVIAGYTSVSVVDLITDFCILVLPIKMVFNLRMKIGHKIALSGIFGAGLITMVFTAIRLYFIYNVNLADLTSSSLASAQIGIAQTGIAVMVASSPLLRPVFDRTLGSWFGLSSSSLQQRSTKRTTNKKKSAAGDGGGDVLPLTIGRIRLRMDAAGVIINESEENLQQQEQQLWRREDVELAAVGGQKGYEREITVEAGGPRESMEAEGAGGNTAGILVTRSTVVL